METIVLEDGKPIYVLIGKTLCTLKPLIEEITSEDLKTILGDNTVDLRLLKDKDE